MVGSPFHVAAGVPFLVAISMPAWARALLRRLGDWPAPPLCQVRKPAARSRMLKVT